MYFLTEVHNVECIKGERSVQYPHLSEFYFSLPALARGYNIFKSHAAYEFTNHTCFAHLASLKIVYPLAEKKKTN